MSRMIAVLMSVVLFAAPLRAEKIRDLITILGAEPIHVEGTGIVTGLNGTGDKTPAALKLLKGFLEKNHIAVDLIDLSSSNIALVRFDAEVPPFVRPGHKISVRVTSIGDSSSLAGGVLMKSALKAGTEGPIFGWAFGRVQVNSSSPRSGKIPANSSGGAQITKVIPTSVVEADGRIRLNLKRRSFADSAAIARRINREPGLNPNLQEVQGFAESEMTKAVAWALDAGQVIVRIPLKNMYRRVEYISQFLALDVPVERPARILVNRQTGTVVITGDVRVERVVISHANKTITLAPAGPQRTKNYRLDEADPRVIAELDGPGQNADLQSMINTLNAMNLSTQDVITILEKIKAAGALHAELTVE